MERPLTDKRQSTLRRFLVKVALAGLGIMIVVGGCASWMVTDYYIIKPRRDAKAKQRMSDIAQALEAYRDANGSYPQALTTLVPRYLSTLPESPLQKQVDDWVIKYTTAASGQVSPTVFNARMQESGGWQYVCGEHQFSLAAFGGGGPFWYMIVYDSATKTFDLHAWNGDSPMIVREE